MNPHRCSRSSVAVVAVDVGVRARRFRSADSLSAFVAVVVVSESLFDARDIGTLADALPDDVCNGSSGCRAAVHIHGCNADYGACDRPNDHGPDFGGQASRGYDG